MAYEIDGFAFTLEAAADLSAKQHHLLAVDSSSQVDSAGVGASVVAIGVLQNKPNAQGIAASIHQTGISKVVAGAAVAAGALVTTNAAGRAITATTGDFVSGTALEAAANDGEVIAVLLGQHHIAL